MAFNADFNLADYESSDSSRSRRPSAPPRQGLVIGNEAYTDEEPPRYQDFSEGWPKPPPHQQYPQQTQYPQKSSARGTLTHSLAIAGASVGHFFGVHDDPTNRGWRRTGTVHQNPNSRRAHENRHTAGGLEQGTQYMPRSHIAYENTHVGDETGLVAEQTAASEQETANDPRPQLRQVSPNQSPTSFRPRKRKPNPQQVKDSLPKFWPVVTVLIALIEIGLLIAVIVTGGGFAPIQFVPMIEGPESIVGFDNVSVTVSRSIVPNFFIGASSEWLVHTGALYAPCMRENIEFQLLATKNILEETSLRCCRSEFLEQCGMLPQEICVEVYNGRVLGGAQRCRNALNDTSDCMGGVVLHPCCVGLLGQCVITTEQNCTFQEGYWHEDKVLCSEVGTDCFNDICEFSWIRKTIGDIPDQGLRFLSAIFLYHGIVQLVLIGLLKFYVSWVIERRIGFLRFICIYIISGVGGFVLSGIFDPTSVSVGGSGALFGLFGVLVVELLQGWKWATKPWLQLIKLIIFIVFLLAIGTLPYVDNFSQIGGFIFGVLASFVFVPYITLGKWDRAVKLCLILTSLPIILVLFLFGFVVFYNLSDPNFCPECSYINCIPYTDTFCDDFITTILSIAT